MRLAKLYLLVLLLLPGGVLANGGERSDHRRIAMLLFPETASWTAVDSMKRVDEKWLGINLVRLKEAYFARKVNERFGQDVQFLYRTRFLGHKFVLCCQVSIQPVLAEILGAFEGVFFDLPLAVV